MAFLLQTIFPMDDSIYVMHNDLFDKIFDFMNAYNYKRQGGNQ